MTFGIGCTTILIYAFIFNCDAFPRNGELSKDAVTSIVAHFRENFCSYYQAPHKFRSKFFSITAVIVSGSS